MLEATHPITQVTSLLKMRSSLMISAKRRRYLHLIHACSRMMPTKFLPCVCAQAMPPVRRLLIWNSMNTMVGTSKSKHKTFRSSWSWLSKVWSKPSCTLQMRTRRKWYRIMLNTSNLEMWISTKILKGTGLKMWVQLWRQILASLKPILIHQEQELNLKALSQLSTRRLRCFSTHLLTELKA